MEYQFSKTISHDKLDRELRASCPHYTGVRTDLNEVGAMTVIVSTAAELSIGEELVLGQIMDDHDPVDITLSVKSVFRKSIIGVQDIVEQFATENVLMGITEAGKTKLISDTVAQVMYYCQTGALFEAVNALQAIELTEPMAPFLTETRRTEYVQKFQALLASL